ncbi:MAG: hypothetical protein Q7U52_11530 [Hydrogenophaga sp.]|uniref:hypothetical protein n=1 Tax=Hydrogenophaga sp. TaxID=1904254 RepID=UPI002723A0BE|nr:hypothetical protein [Hydrogenophaga sp.]MDO9148271.1 hypothetical protein [Hydrogenophaga sp.]MDO9606045.1 hypothetical protein [Hydrogenophaga sp.]
MTTKSNSAEKEQLNGPANLPEDEIDAGDPTRICWTQLLREAEAPDDEQQPASDTLDRGDRLT